MAALRVARARALRVAGAAPRRAAGGARRGRGVGRGARCGAAGARGEALEALEALLEEATRAARAAEEARGDASAQQEGARRAAEAEDGAVAAAREAAALGALPRFGGGALVPKRAYELEELRLNRLDPAAFLSPVDDTLERLQGRLTAGLGLASLASVFAFGVPPDKVVTTGATAVFAAGVDAVGYGGAAWGLVLDSAARALDGGYGRRVAVHEAGHFLVAYLVGILPRGYTLSSLDAFRQYGALRVQAGCLFCDGDFQRAVRSGKLRSSELDSFACVALAGVAAEVMCFGRAEGGAADVAQLDGILRALGFDQTKATKQVRWTVLAVTLLLREFRDVHAALADAMDRGASVSECVALIEDKTDALLPDYVGKGADARHVL